MNLWDNTCTKYILKGIIISSYLHLQSEGVPFIIDGKTVNLCGALTSVVANNPASNLIGGFKNFQRHIVNFTMLSCYLQTKVSCVVCVCVCEHMHACMDACVCVCVYINTVW